MIKNCLTCSKKLSGRSDKKFCTLACKNDFHNTRKVNADQEEMQFMLISRRNRQILNTLLEDGVCSIPKVEMEHHGIRFDGITGVEEAEQGYLILRCFEFTLEVTSQGLTIGKRPG